MTDSPEVVIVGGGVIGAAVAYFLAKRGIPCSLLDKGRIGGESSNAASGILSSSPGESQYSRLAQRSLSLFHELTPVIREESGIDIEFVECGDLTLAMNENDAIALRGLAGQLSAMGDDVRWVGSDDLREMEPLLNPAIPGGMFASASCRVNNQRLASALVLAAQRYGAEVRQGVEVTGIAVENGRVSGVMQRQGFTGANIVVLAAGAWTGAMDRWLYDDQAPSDTRVPMVKPVKGVNLNVQPAQGSVGRMIHGSWGILVPRNDGSMIVGATVEEAGFDTRVTAGDVHSILGVGNALMPSLRDAEINWSIAGLRPGSGDDLPVIGRMPGYDNVLVASGHYRNGILLSLATGEVVADLVEGSNGQLLSDFDPERFF
ncbi:MAG: glycine oxidase ThiO [Dehalococcoidia bacterium]|nr:glycine oxidase ThiO [Dehalococcoidia bacterium]